MMRIMVQGRAHIWLFYNFCRNKDRWKDLRIWCIGINQGTTASCCNWNKRNNKTKHSCGTYYCIKSTVYCHRTPNTRHTECWSYNFLGEFSPKMKTCSMINKRIQSSREKEGRILVRPSQSSSCFSFRLIAIRKYLVQCIFTIQMLVVILNMQSRGWSIACVHQAKEW